MIFTFLEPQRLKRAKIETTRRKKVLQQQHSEQKQQKWKSRLAIPFCMTVTMYIGLTCYVLFIRGIITNKNTSNREDEDYPDVDSMISALVHEYYTSSFNNEEVKEIMLMKMSACGFWTCTDKTPFVIHLLGLCIILPCFLLTQYYYILGGILLNRSMILYSIYPCIGTFIVCNGIPYLRYASILCFSLGYYTYSSLSKREYHQRMSM